MNISAVGYVRSSLKERSGAPRQGWEGSPNARLEVHPAFVECLEGIQPGQDIWMFTWLHEAQRSVRKVHPRGDARNPMMGVFATRSPDRPNPIRLHCAKVLSVDGTPASGRGPGGNRRHADHRHQAGSRTRLRFLKIRRSENKLYAELKLPGRGRRGGDQSG